MTSCCKYGLKCSDDRHLKCETNTTDTPPFPLTNVLGDWAKVIRKRKGSGEGRVAGQSEKDDDGD